MNIILQILDKFLELIVQICTWGHATTPQQLLIDKVFLIGAVFGIATCCVCTYICEKKIGHKSENKKLVEESKEFMGRF